MKAVVLVLFVVLLPVCPIAASEWISLDPDKPPGSRPEISVIACDAGRTCVEIKIPGFGVEPTPEGSVLCVPGWRQTWKTDLPALPCTSFLVALPGTVPISVAAEVSDSRVFDGIAVRRAREPGKDRAAAPQAGEVGTWQGFYPALVAEPGIPGRIASLAVSSIEINPFRMEGATGRLVAASRFVVTVHHGSARSAWPPVPLSDHRAALCAASVINFEYVPLIPAGRGDAEYLVITRSYLEAAIQPLVEWRNRTGFRTELRTVSTAAPQSTKDIILEYPDVEYVLLAGDTRDISMSSWSGIFGDHWYACTTGGSNPDLYADLSIGRLCGSDGARIAPQVDKILSYEKAPPTGGWLKKTLLVAHKEGYPYKYTGCKETIADNLARWSDWSIVKLYGVESGVTNTALTQQVESGVNLLNYRGHGTTDEWWEWNVPGESYFNADVLALQNNDKRPVVFNICCTNANIFSYCLCEAWLDAAGGAVAALGATTGSWTDPNHVFDQKLYEALFSLGVRDIGGMLDFADNHLVGMGGYAVDNVKMYLWLGDPAMRVWLDTPSDLECAYHPTIGTGQQAFGVYVAEQGAPVDGAAVCLLKEDEVFEVGTTGAGGVVSLTVAPSSSGWMHVTVTHPDYLPHEGGAIVEGPEPVAVDCVPEGTVFSPGERLTYRASVLNCSPNPQSFFYWCDVTLPDLSTYPPGGSLIPPVPVVLGPYGSRSGVVDHDIPAAAPIGDYVYNGRVGPIPVVWDEDRFSFQVVP